LFQIGFSSIPKGDIVGIDVCYSVSYALMVGIDVNWVSWVASEVVMHVHVWLQEACVWMMCRWSLEFLPTWRYVDRSMICMCCIQSVSRGCHVVVIMLLHRVGWW